VKFIPRFYNKNDTSTKLSKLLDYYDNYSKIFPNYIILHEAKYLYKNIQKKQKMIDNIQMYEYNKQHKDKSLSNDNIFNTEIYNSILNQTVSVYQCNKENSELLKSFKRDNVDNITHDDSLEKLLGRICIAEEGKSKNNKYLMLCESATVTSDYKADPQHKTIDISSFVSKNGTKLDAIASKFENNLFPSNQKVITEVLPVSTSQNLLRSKVSSDVNVIKGMRDRLDNMKVSTTSKSKFGGNTSSKKIEQKTAVNYQNSSSTVNPPTTATHKTTLSMPKLTSSNIFYIINQHPVQNTHITIYQNINNNNNNPNATSKNINFSPSVGKDFNMTNGFTRNNLTNNNHTNLRSSEKKKSYKKLLRPELLSQIAADNSKKSPFEIKITKVHNGGGSAKKSPFPADTAGEMKNSREVNYTMRNVNKFLINSSPEEVL
jgi:hypothetical protein